MRKIEVNGRSYGLPFEHLLKPLPPAQFAELEADVLEHGVQQAVVVATTPQRGRILVEGMHRAIVCERHGLDCPVVSLGNISDRAARSRCLSLNAKRRHLSPDEVMAALAEARGRRVERVAAASGEGKSLRAIAAAEGVSHEQVRQDLIASGVKGLTPGRVGGSDGKSYPARARRPAKRLPPPEKARRLALRLCRLVERIAASPAAQRLEEIARGHGLPMTGEQPRPRPRKGAPKQPPATRWPALDALAAVLRDLAAGGASG